MAEWSQLERLSWSEALSRPGAWDEVRAHAPTETVFLTPDWLETWWRHLGGHGDPAILSVTSSGSTTAIAPLFRARIAVGGPLVLRPFGIGVCDYLDLLVPADEAGRESALGTLLDGLLARSSGWDVIDLPGLPAESPTVGSLLGLAASRCLPTALLHGYRRPAICLQGQWPDFLETRPGKVRYNLRSRLRRLEKLGNVRFQSIRDADGVSGALPLLVDLHARRWAGQRTSTIFSSSSRGRAFYAEACRRYARRGLVDLSLLEVGGRAAAGCLSFVERGTFYYYMPAWEPELAACAPSSLLLANLIERAFEAGLRRFDFMLGEEEYKGVWATEQRGTVRLLIANGSAGGRAGLESLASLHRIRQRARESAALRVLRRLGVAAALRHWRAERGVSAAKG